MAFYLIALHIHTKKNVLHMFPVRFLNLRITNISEYGPFAQEIVLNKAGWEVLRSSNHFTCNNKGVVCDYGPAPFECYAVNGAIVLIKFRTSPLNPLPKVIVKNTQGIPDKTERKCQVILA